MLACYQKDDRPLRTAPAFVATIGSIAKKLKVRGSAKELRPVATPQAVPQHLPASSSSDKEPMDNMVTNHLFGMMEKQAKALDALTEKINGNSLGKTAPSQSLGSGGTSPRDSNSLIPKALPAPTAPLPLPAPGDSATLGEEECTQTKSLQDYEDEAKALIAKRKAKDLDTAMKRPASKKGQAKAAPKQKAAMEKITENKKKHVTPTFLKGIFGCVRCRGNVNGCSTCHSPHFSGTRFSSREEWSRWHQRKQQGLKGK